MNKTQTVLADAQGLIKSYGWVRGAYGHEGMGFCALGALNKAGAASGVLSDLSIAVTALANAVQERRNSEAASVYGAITLYNDYLARGQADVESLFDRAIELAGDPQ